MLETFNDFISLGVIIVMLILSVYCLLVLTSSAHQLNVERRQRSYRRFLENLADEDALQDSKE